MTHITIASVVKDEMDRFLPEAIECWVQLADSLRILDNGSSDDTTFLLNDMQAKHPDLRWGTCPTPMDGNEWVVRRELFRYATENAPGWVIWLDADQVLSSDPRPYLTGNRVAFYVYDMWDEESYRKDAWWKTAPWWQAIYAPALGDRDWLWNQRGWHSSHVPKNIREIGPVTHMPKDCAVLHYAYAAPDLRARQHSAYMCRKQHLTTRELFHANTILSPYVKTYPLPFEPEYRLHVPQAAER